MNTVQQKIEALLFFKNEPTSYSWLAKRLEVPVEEIKKEVEAMVGFYENRGIQMIVSEGEVSLLTSAVATDVIETLSRAEEERDLSKQALETLAIILYRKEVTKSEIDYIRGVNSVFILRNLLIRGLIQKKTNPQDKRSPYYVATHDTLATLGVQKAEDLPHFSALAEKVEAIHRDWKKEQESDLLKD